MHKMTAAIGAAAVLAGLVTAAGPATASEAARGEATGSEAAGCRPALSVLWPGSGPVLALPRLADGMASEAVAVSDDDRAAGSAVNASGQTRAVVWKCATRQAYAPNPS
jgi:hypothetical protein